ncbi:MAG: M14 family metallopeptidase [Elusimicrobiaceae bacterium]|nr:M14 family metallopeptidase [Elusimicrobiaceae bacterium]
MIRLFLALAFFAPQAYCGQKAADSLSSLSQLNAAASVKIDKIGLPHARPALAGPDKTDSPLNGRFWVTVEAPTREDRGMLEKNGLAFESFNGKYVSGTIDSESLAQIRKLGFKITYQATLADFNLNFIKDFPPQDARYHNYSEMYGVLKEINEKLPDLTTLMSIGKTFEGREIWALRFNSTEKTGVSKKPGVAYLGAHHAREHLSVELPLAFAQWLADNSAKPEVKKLMQERDVFIIPMVNADGAEYDIAKGQYAWWRKNRAKLPNSSSIGVDLNRNYGWHWGGDSTNPGSETYQGPEAFSEPESSAVKNFFDTYTNMKIMISYHTYGQMVLYPWGDVYDQLEDKKDLQAHITIARKIAAITGYRAMQSSELYPATGDSCDWSYGAHKVLSFTIEADPGRSGYGGFYPGSAIVDTASKYNNEASYYVLQKAGDPYSDQ